MIRPLRIVHLDLSQGLVELPAAECGSFVVVWWRQLPIGHIEIKPEHLPMRLPELANRIAQAIAPAVGDRLFDQGFRAAMPSHARASPRSREPVALHELLEAERPLQRLAAIAADDAVTRAGAESRLSISVVVCTRDRADSLRRCLRSLGRLSAAPDEIVVVDNASRDDTRDVVCEFPRVRYEHEARAGLDIARNTGVRASRGDIIAFADDDVEVHPQWAARLRAAFSDPTVMAATGLVLPAELETDAQRLFEASWSFNRGYRARTFDRAWFERELPRGIPADQIGAGANMAFRRDVFTRVGGFDERLDVGAAGCSGDSEMWYRILAAGFSCRYEPAAVVFHHHRRSTEELDRQIFQYMRGHVAALLVQFERHRHSGNLRRLLFSLPLHYLERLAGSMLTPERRRTIRPQVEGHLAGVRFYFSRHVVH